MDASISTGRAKIAPPTWSRSAAIDAERSEQAFRAVRRFREMVPQLTGFARAITGDPDIEVEVSPTLIATDGRKIFMRPPFELGEWVEHEVIRCGVRDEVTSQQLCPACAQLDTILSDIFHEMGHLTGDSFHTMVERDRNELLERALDERREAWMRKSLVEHITTGETKAASRYDKLKAAVDRVKDDERLNYVNVANAISPFLPTIINALEDARVNRMMIEARPGTYEMFRARSVDVFTNGFKLPDGSLMRWEDAPPDSQVVIALYCAASNYDYDEWFAPEIIEAMRDREIATLLHDVRNARTIATIYRLAFPVLEALRRLGFCRLDTDVEDDEPEPSDAESGTTITVMTFDDDESSGAPAEGGSGSDKVETSDDGDDTDDDGSPSDDDSDDTDGESDDDSDDTDGESDGDSDGTDDDDEGDDDEGTGTGGSGPDDADEGEFEDDDSEAREEAARAYVEDISRLFGKFSGHDPDVPKFDPAKAEAEADVDRAIVQEASFDEASATMYGVREFTIGDADPQAAWWQKNMVRKFDDLMPDPALLNMALLKTRITFAANKKTKPEHGYRAGRVNSRRLPMVAVGDDRVFSRTRRPGKRDYFIGVALDISGSTNSGPIKVIRPLGMALGELFSRAGIKFAMYAHTGGGHPGMDKYDLHMYRIKGPNDPWGNTQRHAVAALAGQAANLDGHTVEFMRRMCDRVNATDKIILHVTDGAMPAENPTDEVRVLRREIETCKRSGIEVVGVAVRNRDPSKYGLPTVRLDRVDDLHLIIEYIDARLNG